MADQREAALQYARKNKEKFPHQKRQDYNL